MQKYKPKSGICTGQPHVAGITYEGIVKWKYNAPKGFIDDCSTVFLKDSIVIVNGGYNGEELKQAEMESLARGDFVGLSILTKNFI